MQRAFASSNRCDCNSTLLYNSTFNLIQAYIKCVSLHVWHVRSYLRESHEHQQSEEVGSLKLLW